MTTQSTTIRAWLVGLLGTRRQTARLFAAQATELAELRDARVELNRQVLELRHQTARLATTAVIDEHRRNR